MTIHQQIFSGFPLCVFGQAQFSSAKVGLQPTKVDVELMELMTGNLVKH
jgi:hypothetical protein